MSARLHQLEKDLRSAVARRAYMEVQRIAAEFRHRPRRVAGFSAARCARRDAASSSWRMCWNGRA